MVRFFGQKDLRFFQGWNKNVKVKMLNDAKIMGIGYTDKAEFISVSIGFASLQVVGS